MNKLEELINIYCPGGVEYKTLGDIGSFTRGKRFVKADAVEIGTPCIHYGELYTHYGISAEKTKSFVRDELASKLRFAEPNDVVIVGAGENDRDIGVGVAWLGTEKVAVHDACYIFKHNCNPKYISYFLRTTGYHLQIKKYVSSGKICSISSVGLEKAIIPIPPLYIQDEIVRVLDNMTSLISELTAELKLRQKQYEYYRNTLLRFDEVNTNEVSWMKLGECCDVLTGFPFDSSQFSTTGVRLMRGMNVKRGYLDFAEENNKYWNSVDGLEKYLLESGDIIIAMDGSLVGKSYGVVGIEDLPLLLVQRVARIRSSVVNMRYLYHCIAENLPKYTDKKKTAGAVPHISLKDIQMFPLVVPTLEEQERIANILDKFYALCNDISEGLPAELKARKKQYEYYRDKLLTFEEKET